MSIPYPGDAGPVHFCTCDHGNRAVYEAIRADRLARNGEPRSDPEMALRSALASMCLSNPESCGVPGCKVCGVPA